MTDTTHPRLNPLHLAAAFASGCLLTLMVHFNGQLAHYGSALVSSWTAHGTGTVAALIYLAIMRPKKAPAAPEKPKAPLWAYCGGVVGAAIVILTSTAVNSPLALSGTIALGLGGQVIFSLLADLFGLFGLPKRRPDMRDMAAVALILCGSALIILVGRTA
ncbi:MAG: DMT family transporter [Agrobacterium sp.]|nr:DMT family transporter [Agrobacterium sp.]